jgi:hypothetical protein
MLISSGVYMGKKLAVKHDLMGCLSGNPVRIKPGFSSRLACIRRESR